MSSTASVAPARAAMAVVPGQGQAARRFAGRLLVASLFLQRFAVPLGSQGVDLVGPIGLLLALLALRQGTLVFHRRRTQFFLALAAWTILGAAWQAIHPNSYGTGLNINSLMQFLLLTGFCTLSFAEAADEQAFFRGAADILCIIAVAGLLQFALQFVGLGLFSFTGLVPDRLLFENGYNLVIPADIGDALKSNGFFMLEPSMFSQAMAMAMILEAFSARRPWRLALFTVALILSFSGTGWLVLGSFLLSVGVRLGGRGVMIGASVAAVIVVLAAVVLLVAPDTASVFSERYSELSQPGTSGNLRFSTPFQLMHDVMSHEAGAWLVGIGPGASERLDLAYDYNVNTPIKIMLEYGIPALLFYVGMLLSGERSRLQGALLVPGLVLLFLAGGYQEFAPALFPMFLLLCIARLRAAPVAARQGWA